MGVGKTKNISKLFGDIPQELIPLAKEVLKYKTANEFREAFTQEHLTDLSDYHKHRWGRAICPYADEVDYVSVADVEKNKEVGGYLDTIKYEYPNIYKKIINSKDAIEIYRAVPKDTPSELAVGDYVALNKEYAELHGEGVLKGQFGLDYKIISQTVPKEDVIWGQADFAEWIYSPKKVRDVAVSLEDFFETVKKQIK